MGELQWPRVSYLLTSTGALSPGTGAQMGKRDAHREKETAPDRGSDQAGKYITCVEVGFSLSEKAGTRGKGENQNEPHGAEFLISVH